MTDIIVDDDVKFLRDGFRFFPLVKNGKIPTVKNFTQVATTDLALIKQWISLGYNIGISTDHAVGGWHLVVVDVDTKDDKKGAETLLALELEGYELPPTLTQKTASGGFHYIYKTRTKVYGGNNKLGLNVDVKAHGGYIVAEPSKINGIPYTFVSSVPVAECPPWLVSRLVNKDRETKDLAPTAASNVSIDRDAANKRAKEFLTSAPPAVSGEGGNGWTYYIACKVKDEGVEARTCLELMLDWNEKCEPPWSIEELKGIIFNAYKYGDKEIGASSPEVIFKDVVIEETEPESKTELDMVLKEFNKTYSVIGMSGEVIFDALNSDGALEIFRMQRQQFINHNSHVWASTKPEGEKGNKRVLVPKYWLSWQHRNRFLGTCFEPGRARNVHGHFNLWRGFAYKPLPSVDDLTQEQRDVLNLVLEHIHENIADGDEEAARWFTTYFADMIQRPGDKPQVAVSLFGGKGTGKSAIFNWLGALLGPHYDSSSQRQSLVGNFNSQLENLVMFNLEEAFWSGDKQAEGALKDIVTGKRLRIERKGYEGYKSKNFIRVTMCSNERWSFPASEDERRLCAFKVGDRKKQNNEWFQKISDGLKLNGGYQALITYLNTYDLNSANINYPLQNEALLIQKEETLDTLGKFWLSCLEEGAIINSYEDNWPTEGMLVSDFIDAFSKTLGSAKSIYTTNPATISRRLKEYVPWLNITRKRTEGQKRRFSFPDLEVCRKSWDERMKIDRKWD